MKCLYEGYPRTTSCCKEGSGEDRERRRNRAPKPSRAARSASPRPRLPAEAVAEAAATQDFLPTTVHCSLPPSPPVHISTFHTMFISSFSPSWVFAKRDRDRMTDRAKGRPLKSFPEKSLNCQIDPLVGTRSVGVLVQTERERESGRLAARGRMALEGSLKGAIAESVAHSVSRQARRLHLHRRRRRRRKRKQVLKWSKKPDSQSGQIAIGRWSEGGKWRNISSLAERSKSDDSIQLD